MRLVGTLRNHQPRRQRDRQKTIGSMRKTTPLHLHHVLLYISLSSLHNNDVKRTNFKFTWEREQQDDKLNHISVRT